MWKSSRELAPRRSPFRAGCIGVALLLFALLAGAAVFGWVFLDATYGKKARAFDLTELDKMERATAVFDKDGNQIGKFFVENREIVPIGELPPHLIQAVIAAEDARFHKHRGVDYIGVVRAWTKNVQAGRKAQGGSTVTQQLARNTFKIFEKSYERKLVEIFLAWEIEKRFSKQRIMELYLNRVFFGASFHGVEAAAQGYFGKSARELTLSESATLAGLLKNPNGLSPWSDRAACIDNRNFVLDRMLELKLITAEQRAAAKAEELVVRNRRPVIAQSYAMEIVERQAKAILGEEELDKGGYRIHTTLDTVLQKAAEEGLRKRLFEVETRKGYEHPTYSKFDVEFKKWRRELREGGEAQKPPEPAYLQGAVTVLDNRTGAILAHVGGRDFAHSQYDRATLAARPAGTVFKPLVYAAAFEKGFFPGTLVEDAVIDNRQVMIGGYTGILGEWGSERADNRYEGQITAREALVRGKNAATVRLGSEVGVEAVARLAQAAGIKSPLRPFPNSYLGSSEVTLSELTLAFTAFPGGGTRPKAPWIIAGIEDANGRVVFRAEAERVKVMRDSTAYEVHTCLADSLEVGTADRAFAQYGLRRFPVGGKTGTAYNFTDLWFIGYSSEVTCGVWVGFDKPRTPIYRGAFSSEVALPVWVDVMNASFGAYPAREIAAPRSVRRVELCRTSGALATERCQEMVLGAGGGEMEVRSTRFTEWADVVQAPRFPCPVHGSAEDIAAAQEAMKNQRITQVVSGNTSSKAQVATDLSGFVPVMMRAPTIVGFDPFGAESTSDVVVAAEPVAAAGVVEGVVAAEPVGGPEGAGKGEGGGKSAPAIAVPADPEVVRAEPIGALEQQPVDDNPLKLEAPPPLEF